jgi:diguanylate cyclase (GGDEF)-like protein
MESIAAVDQMTGLYNRNAYLQVARKITQPGRFPLLIILGDVNNLKQINDTFGHLLGDELLRNVSSIVKQFAPRDSFIARIGGDEIVLLVPNSSEAVAEKFVADFDAAALACHNEDFGCPSVSWGWSLFQDPEEEYNTVFHRADAAMYARKSIFKKMNPFQPSGVLPPSDQ